MIYITSTNKVSIITSTSATIDYSISFGELLPEYYGTISSATTVLINPTFPPTIGYVGITGINIINTDTSSSCNIEVRKNVGTVNYVVYKATLAAGDNLIFGSAQWTVYDKDGKIKVLTSTGGGGGGSDGYNIIAAGSQTAESTGTVYFANSNGVTFGMSNSSIVTASYTVPATTQFQHSSLMTNYLGTTYTSHTHSQYVNTSVSSNLQHTSAMTNYLGTTYTSHTHSQYINTSQSSLFQATSLMTDYLGTNYTTHTHSSNPGVISAGTSSESISTLVFSNSNGLTFGLDSGTITGSYTVPSVTEFQQSSLMSNYLGTTYTSHTHSQYLTTQTVQTQNMVSVQGSTGDIFFENGNGMTFGFSNSTITASYTVPATTQLLQTSQSSLFQQTSQMTDYLGTGYTTHTHSQYINTSQSSLFQQTSLMSDYLGTGYTTHTHSQYINTSVSSVFQQTSLMSDYLGTGYTTHTHSQYLTTARASNDAIGLNTAQSNVTWTINSSGLSLDARGYAGTGTSATNASVTLNSNGLAISVAAPVTTTGLISAINVSAGTTSNNLSRVTFDNGNGISFGLNGSVVTGSHNGLTSQSNQAFSASGGSTTFQTLNFANSNGITFSNSNGSLIASHNGITQQSTQPVAASGSNGSFAFSTLSFGNLNGMSFYTSNGSIVGSYTDGGGAGGGIALANSQTTFTASTVNLSAAGALTIASTTGQSLQFSVPNTSLLSATGLVSLSTNGNTISIGVPTPMILNYFNPQDGYVQVVGQQGNASMHFQPMQAPNVQFDRLALPMNFTNATNTTGSATVSMSIGFYTNNASTLSLLSSVSYSAAVTYSGTVNNSTFAGLRLHTLPFTGTFTEGQYYVAIWSRTTSGGANGTLNQILASQMNSSYSGLYGVASNTSMQYTRGLGHYSVTFSTAIPSAVPFTDIRGVSSIVLRQPVFYLLNGTV